MAVVGDGNNCWSAAHISDVTALYLRVLEQGLAGRRYHAVAEEAIPSAHRRGGGGELHLPLQSLSADRAAAHFGWFAAFAGMDLRATSVWTRQQLNWQPTGPGLLDDLRHLNHDK